MSIIRTNIILIFIFLIIAANFGFGQEGQDDSEESDYIEVQDYLEEEVEETERLSLLNFSISLNQPLDPTTRNIDRLKVGFKLSFLRSFEKYESLSAGLVIHNFRLDRLVQDYVLFGDFENFNVTTATTSKLLYTGLGMRYYTSFYSNKFEPYIEGEIGVNHIYTKSLDEVAGAEEGNLSYETYHASLGYMIGIGIQYNVGFLTALHFTTNFHGSTAARYYIAEDLGFEIPWDNFRIRKGQMNFITNTIGITFGF